MSIFVGVTTEEVGQIETAIKGYLARVGVVSPSVKIEARNVYREDDGSITASVIVSDDWIVRYRSSYILEKVGESTFLVK